METQKKTQKHKKKAWRETCDIWFVCHVSSHFSRRYIYMMYVYCAPICMSIKLTNSLTGPEIFKLTDGCCDAGRRLFQNGLQKSTNRPFYFNCSISFAAFEFCAVVNWRLNSIVRQWVLWETKKCFTFQINSHSSRAGQYPDMVLWD